MEGAGSFHRRGELVEEFHGFSGGGGTVFYAGFCESFDEFRVKFYESEGAETEDNHVRIGGQNFPAIAGIEDMSGFPPPVGNDFIGEEDQILGVRRSVNDHFAEDVGIDMQG